MAVPVRIPSDDEDRAPAARIAAIAVVFLVLGVGIARWGTASSSRDESGDAPGSGSGRDTRDGMGSGSGQETGDRPGSRSGQDTRDGTETAAAPTAAPQPDEAADPDPSQVASPDPDPSPSARPDPDPGPSPSARPDPDPGPSPFSLIRGRVAYLRCDGVPQRAGPVPCPRDELLEQQVWTAIDRLLECTAMPRAAGEADVVVDFLPGAIPETRARDTFARDVVRLDAERVVACLTPQLATVTQSVGASRLVVSFRFAIAPREPSE